MKEERAELGLGVLDFSKEASTFSQGIQSLIKELLLKRNKKC